MRSLCHSAWFLLSVIKVVSWYNSSKSHLKSVHNATFSGAELGFLDRDIFGNVFLTNRMISDRNESGGGFHSGDGPALPPRHRRFAYHRQNHAERSQSRKCQCTTAYHWFTVGSNTFVFGNVWQRILIANWWNMCCMALGKIQKKSSNSFPFSLVLICK